MNAGMYNLILLIAFLALMYFLLIRPQRKQDKEIKAMRASLKVGDEIVTIGGIVGKVVRIKEDRILMETGTSKMKIEILKSAVGSVVGKKAEEKAAEAKDQKAEKAEEEEKPAPRRDKKVTPKKLGGEKTEKAEKAEEAEAPAAEEEPKAE